MYKILAICPYLGLRDVFEKVNKDFNKNIDIEVGNLYEGLKIAKDLEHKGYDAIISRGATATIIRENFTIPVLDIKITGYDILRNLTLLHGYSGKIAMMSYLNAIQGAEHIGKLLNMDLTFYEINTKEEIEENINQALKDGVQIIIGDVISTEAANKVGIQGILITSGTEAVLETIEEAERMLFYLKQQSRQRERITRVLDHLDAGVLIFDCDNNCTALNQKVRKQLNIPKVSSPFSWKSLVELVPQLEQLQLDSDRNITDVSVYFNGHQLTFKIVELSFENDEEFALIIRDKHWNEEKTKRKYLATYHFNSLMMRGESTKKLIESAQKISKSNLPIIIYGEPGAGKNTLAQAIHNESERKKKNYVFINCEAYSEIQLEKEFFGYEDEKIIQGVFELADEGTLFIDAIDKLPISLQGKFYNVITTKKVSRLNGSSSIPIDVRIICSALGPLEKKVSQGEFREDLYYAINVFNLKVPPLRERTEDFEDLIRMFIASINVSNGKQIIGFRPEVMSVLKSLKWPGNIYQLKNTIEQICIISNGPFVDLKDAEPILSRILTKSILKNSNNELNINNKTLEQIEQEIIHKVLEQEDFNQSKASERLGINRTTLWRKIKNGNNKVEKCNS